MRQFDNTSILFLPFRVNPNLFDMIAEAFSSSSWWEEDKIDLRYFFRFVANKVDGSDGRNRCRHYVISERKKQSSAAFTGVCERFTDVDYPVSRWFLGRFSVVVENMELFLFSTGVCLLTIRLSQKDADERSLVNARAVIRKVAVTQYRTGEEETPFTLLELARESVSEVAAEYDAEFFYYTIPKNTIAYMMTLYYHEERLDDMLLLYLQDNASLNHRLSEERKESHLNKICITEPLVWAVSDQSAICVCSSFGNDSFLKRTFPKNFKKEYQYMFAFLLHQKFMLYSFLMQIDTELENNIEKLEEYKKRLSDFKTYFVFSRISEVINYQLLYSEVSEAFSLERMYEDVEEPLEMLDRILLREAEKSKVLQNIREEQAEKKRGERENRLNLALAALSLVEIVSAFTDAGDLSSKLADAYMDAQAEGVFGRLVLLWKTHPLHAVLWGFLALLIVGVVVKLIVSRRREMKHNCLYYGVFLRPDALDSAMERSCQTRSPLERKIVHPHVTVAYKPGEVPFHLFGERVRVVITGYGSDAENEGVSVTLHSDNTELKELFSQVEVPHITLSVSPTGQTKNTSGLSFAPIERVVELTGVFGEMRVDGKVNTDKKA